MAVPDASFVQAKPTLVQYNSSVNNAQQELILLVARWVLISASAKDLVCLQI